VTSRSRQYEAFYCSPEQQNELRAAIAAAGGNEVFFLGDVGGDGRIVALELLARGNRHMVPALIQRAQPGQMVLHNHPSGTLEPSDADLSVASVCGNNGIGFAIVNNEGTEWYVVVKPHQAVPVVDLVPDDFISVFSSDGALATMIPQFEVREEQQVMARHVAESFNRNRLLLVEAGTGTGKSLAYLLPAVAWALKNGQRVVVSTNTINLQEQLIKKDLPLLQRYTSTTLNTSLVKGRGNYLCQRKLEGVRKDPELFPSDDNQMLEALARWSEQSPTGCLSDLSFQPVRAVWEEVRSEADQCARSRCAFFNSCFFYRARREAAAAHILVVNHALLLADMALRSDAGYDATAILPPFSKLIIDEAHHLEDAATGALTLQVTRRELQKQLGRLVTAGAKGGMLPVIMGRLGREIPEAHDDLYQRLSALIEGRLITECSELSSVVDREFDRLLLASEVVLVTGGERSLRVTDQLRRTDFWRDLTASVETLHGGITSLIALLVSLGDLLEELPESCRQSCEGLAIDIEGIRGRLSSTITGLQSFTAPSASYCCWIERIMHRQQGASIRLASAPMEVGELLHGSLFEAVPTVILTSATIAVAENFSYYQKRTGLDRVATERLTSLMLPSPFRYREQALVALVRDMPEPADPTFLSQVSDAVVRAVRSSNGGVFVLFTAYEQLRIVYKQTVTTLEESGFTVLCQGNGMPRHHMLATFRRECGAVLFGTDSFWEGVDVQGQALRQVIIVRLPFHVPTEPIQEARAELVTRQGGNPFREMALPQAVLRLRQGFGRLIRSRDDSGAVLILDSRIVTKSYGSLFRKSLPPAAQHIVSRTEFDAALGQFYAGLNADGS
jgi:ATP-dependent DNA helicase DinG